MRRDGLKRLESCLNTQIFVSVVSILMSIFYTLTIIDIAKSVFAADGRGTINGVPIAWIAFSFIVPTAGLALALTTTILGVLKARKVEKLGLRPFFNPGLLYASSIAVVVVGAIIYALIGGNTYNHDKVRLILTVFPAVGLGGLGVVALGYAMLKFRDAKQLCIEGVDSERLLVGGDENLASSFEQPSVAVDGESDMERIKSGFYMQIFVSVTGIIFSMIYAVTLCLSIDSSYGEGIFHAIVSLMVIIGELLVLVMIPVSLVAAILGLVRSVEINKITKGMKNKVFSALPSILSSLSLFLMLILLAFNYFALTLSNKLAIIITIIVALASAGLDVFAMVYYAQARKNMSSE